MEDHTIREYLMNPAQVEVALGILETKSQELSFVELFNLFNNTLGIKSGEGFPTTRVFLKGLIYRARVHEAGFVEAKVTDEIGVKRSNISQGRANPPNLPIFYGSNSIETAAYEVLQEKPTGEYLMTIGSWSWSGELTLANLVDGADLDFSEIPFAHSWPNQYLNSWPETPRKSAIMIFQYFSSKFKQANNPGLYNITNIIAGNYFSLMGIDGILYGATSNRFKGVNIALLKTEKIKCTEVEIWRCIKGVGNRFEAYPLKRGEVQRDGTIGW